MKIHAVKDYEEMSIMAARIMIQQIKQKPNSVLGLATGSTPKGLYEQLVHDHKVNKTSYSEISTINLDEYIGLSSGHPNSYRSFMDKHLFNEIDIRPEHIHIPNGKVRNLRSECNRYNQLLAILPIEIQLLGIGENGHIGFNEPGTSFQSKTHVVQLTQSTRNANARFFKTEEVVPTLAITMGIKNILQSKKIILLASGIKKADAMKSLLSNEVDEKFPASSLKLHSNVTIIADQDALAKCERLKDNVTTEEYLW
jgi:glucosamine-6-phosphate deaminase